MRAMLLTMPALLTSTSGGPSSAVHAATASSTASASATSTVSDTARRPISTTAPAVGTASSGPDTRAPQPVVLLALERVGVDVGHGDVGAGGGEGEGDGAADAAGARR